MVFSPQPFRRQPRTGAGEFGPRQDAFGPPAAQPKKARVTGLEVLLRRDGPVGVLTLAGEARLEVIHNLEEPVAQALGEGARSLILDLGRLEFMDSASTGALIRLEKDLTAAGGRLVLCAVPRVIQRLFDAAGLADRFRQVPDQDRARQILSEG